jgi:hypothetical protein
LTRAIPAGDNAVAEDAERGTNNLLHYQEEGVLFGRPGKRRCGAAALL